MRGFIEQEGKMKSYQSMKSGEPKTLDMIGAKVKLQSALNDFSTIREGLDHHTLKIENSNGNPCLKTSEGQLMTKDILSPEQQLALREYFQETEGFLKAQSSEPFDLMPTLNMANDVDDEATHGRKRNKKRKGDNEITR